MSVEVGDIVMWFESGKPGPGGRPALVTKVCTPGVPTQRMRLLLNIADEASYNFRLRDGVCHCDDPTARPDDVKTEGAWQETPQHVRLTDAIEVLMEAVGADKLNAAKSAIEARKKKEEDKRREKDEFERKKKAG